MKNLLDLSYIYKELVKLTYYILLILSISFSVYLILEGISDPFGEFFIIGGALSLILIPLLLKIAFSLIFLKLTMINLNTKTKVDPKDVVWVEGHINYSKIHFINQKPIFLAITLKKIVEKFDSDDFCRINKGKVVNLAHLDIFKTTSDGLIFQNEYLAISRRMKSGFLNQVKTLGK